MMTEDRRVGRFYVQRPFLDDRELMWSMLQHLQFIPHRVEFRYSSDRMLYVGTSPHFDELEEFPAVIPEYVVCVHKDAHGETVTVDRQQ